MYSPEDALELRERLRCAQQNMMFLQLFQETNDKWEKAQERLWRKHMELDEAIERVKRKEKELDDLKCCQSAKNHTKSSVWNRIKKWLWGGENMISLYEQRAEVEFNLESAKKKVESLTKDLEWLNQKIKEEKDGNVRNVAGKEK